VKTDAVAVSSPSVEQRAWDLLYPFLFRLLHWLLWPSMIVLILTGWSLHASSAPQWSLFKGVLPSFFWFGRVHFWHTWAALVFSPAAVAVTWIYLRNRSRTRRSHMVLLAGSMALIVTGILLMTWLGPPLAYQTSRWVHAVGGLVIVPLAFLWHALIGLTRFGRLLPVAFNVWARPRWGQLVFFVPVVVLTTCLILSGLPTHPAYRELEARLIPRKQVATNELDTLPWDEAQPVLIELANGFGFDRGRTDVTLWALHDGEELFVKARWDDPTEDRRNMPWVKTAKGWKRLHTNFDDETHYYEDKFSLAFPIEPGWKFNRFGCAAQCHMTGERQYGFKATNRLVDVWHWKSTRTDPCGQVDDKFWSEDVPDSKDRGRFGDPKESGGYKKNETKDLSRPIALPRDPWKVRQGIIPEEDTADYESDEGARILAEIPVGATIPGIIASPAVGDRGDVECFSRHRDGVWQLFIRRKLDTGHPSKKTENGEEEPTDLVFEPGKTYPFGCAAFDHASKRHAYGLTPYWLKLEEKPEQ